MRARAIGNAVVVDRREANSVAEKRLEQLRPVPYDELVSRYSMDAGNAATWEHAVGASGVRYNLKLFAYWDDGPPNLRVFVNADDGSRLGFTFPVTASFVVAPDGSIIGE